MGYDVFTEHTFDRATAAKGVSFTRDREGHRHTASNVTAKAEQHVRKTGRPPRRVDPAADGVIRRSLMRFEPLPDGTFKVTVGFPIPVESSCDTTGSMGNNVNTAMEVLPETYATISEVLPGRDLQLALGIFGDISDRFPMCRPQFEMTAEKIVEYITDLAPERDGDDYPEDQQYPVFAAAYLTDTYANCCGLKNYHFVITDAPMHARLDPDQLERIFGENVWKRLADNGYAQIARSKLPSYDEMFAELHRRAHAFIIGVEYAPEYIGDYRRYYDEHHRIMINDTRCLPAIEAAVIGLTEGTLQPLDIETFLRNHQVSEQNIKAALPGLKKVVFRAQRLLEEKSKLVGGLPKAGDIFASKDDINPIKRAEEVIDQEAEAPSEPAVADADADTNIGWL